MSFLLTFFVVHLQKVHQLQMENKENEQIITDLREKEMNTGERTPLKQSRSHNVVVNTPKTPRTPRTPRTPKTPQKSSTFTGKENHSPASILSPGILRVRNN